jgi:hypothetical protein
LRDRLHDTLRLYMPQQAITIGTPGYRNPSELTLPKILVMAFGQQHPVACRRPVELATAARAEPAASYVRPNRTDHTKTSGRNLPDLNSEFL